MFGVESAGLQNSAAARLASQTDQPAGQIVLPPFSENLSVDEELKLKNQCFKELIANSFNTLTVLGQVQRNSALTTPLLAQFAYKPNCCFFKGKDVTPFSQLIATPPFPTPHVLAQFAYKTYEDYKEGETDLEYETRLNLPEGWMLLTTASNDSITNGYFGAAYWHPDHQQVVIAHRGTDPTNLGALGADIKGVVCNRCVQQMESASTFAHKVVEVLREVNRLKGVSFQLFFTGHSLGGWLAQVTTFATKYLKREENLFLRSSNDKDCYHPHTVVFDSPGCKDMLLQMTEKLDVRLDGRSIDLDHLDITSYLSAPNRINTNNKHEGTVYRIFTDLSDMGWWGKNTALYNLATHSMKKIVEVFDPETGQVQKDEQGQLKVQVVVDRPSAGILHDKEYSSFFEWAIHLNNYHPNPKDVPFQHITYYPIRYQTKLYDERMNSFSVFSEEEQEFLQCYRWLRQWPEFFEPKELFSVLEDNLAQEDAGKLLQTFEIEKDTIHCTDASALQALIPYVKRLLQLFPQIKEKTKCALSSDGVRNRVYQFETRRYVERITKLQLEFNSDVSSFREFLESEQQKVLHLQMVKGDEWTGIIKVHQVLQKNNCLIEGRYTVLKLQRLLAVNRLMDLSKLMQSTVTSHLLLIACEDNQQLDEETRDVIGALFDTIKKKPKIKIIFTTQSKGSTVAFLHHIGRKGGFVRGNEQLTWSDLTTISQEKLLEKSVTFQGTKIFLKELMSAESPAAEYLPLGALLEEQELKIADPVPISKTYNESYYISRTLRHQKFIKEDIFNTKQRKDCPEQEFTEICGNNPNSNVHWLEKDKSGKLFWQQSQGSLKNLRECIDTVSSHTYTPDNLDKLLEQAQHQRVMVISDTAGMGKSTILTHLCKQIKQKFPAKWVLRIDLNDHTDVLKALKQRHIDKEKAIEFISEKLLKLEPGLEMELFKQCCEQNQIVKAVIMLDGFDEISPFYKETVLDLLQALRQTAVEQLWVATRPHLRDELEDKLQQLSYTLEPFSEENQIEFLMKFWCLRDWFTEINSKEKEENKKKLEIFAKDLINVLTHSIGDRDREFAGVPLQTRMLAEAFDKEVKEYCQSAEPMHELPFKLDLLVLYRRFIERKYDIYQEEKFRVQVDNVIVIEQRKRDFKIMRKDHQLLALKVLFTEEALKVLFTEEEIAVLESNSQCIFPVGELTRIGIVQVRHDGKPYFIHRTFAEFYAADYLVNRLTEGNNTSQNVQTFILKDIFLKKDYEVIRVFVDGLLSETKPSQEVLKQNGNLIHDLGVNAAHILHRATQEDNVNIVGFLLHSLQAGEQKQTVIEMLLAQDDSGRTAWHNAVGLNNIQVLEKLWKWAEEKLTTEEINNKLLLATDGKGMTAWHVAAWGGASETLQKLWEWAKEKLTKEEINNNLLLAIDRDGWTVWHVAASSPVSEILQNIWECAKEKLTTEDINNTLLATDGEGRTVWHVAAEKGKPDILQNVWEWAKEKFTREEINKLLLTTDHMGRTAWHMAAEKGTPEILQKLWEWAKEKLTTEEINNTFLLATDDLGRTAWHMAVEKGMPEMLQKVWECATQNLTTEGINNKLLATDHFGRTVWHVAAVEGNPEILQSVWDWAKEKLTTEDINNKLLLATDDEGRTVWHVAAEEGKAEILQKVWELAKENLTTQEIINKLLLGTDGYGRTVWHIAASRGESEILQKIWELAKEKLTTEEINNKLLLATDGEGRTAWHVAAKTGKSGILQSVWELPKEKLTSEGIYIKLLLATDGKENTVWHVAAKEGKPEILQKVWELAKEKLTSEEIYVKLLLATDREGRTVWHVAAEEGKPEILQKVWELAKEKLTTEEINNKLLLATDGKGMPVWHVAAKRGKSELLQKIWELAKENLTTEEINNKLLLATDCFGRTVWHVAAMEGNAEILQNVWELAKEKLTREEISNKLFLATDNTGRTVWHVAGKRHISLLWKLSEWAEEAKLTDEVYKKLVTESKGRTNWQVAADRHIIALLEMVLSSVKRN